MIQTDYQEQEVSFQLLHVGINGANPDEARQVADLYCAMLGKDLSEGATSYFVGSSIEVMKSPFLGTHGHMAYGVLDMEKALQSLEKKGFLPDRNTAVYDENKKLIVIYLQGEVGGFAVHLKLL